MTNVCKACYNEKQGKECLYCKGRLDMVLEMFLAEFMDLNWQEQDRIKKIIDEKSQNSMFGGE